MSVPQLGYDGRPRVLAHQAARLADHARDLGPLPDVPQLIDLVDAAGLQGRGGAWFPTARKLNSLAGKQNTYVVVNGMESEPAAGKDKLLLRRAPHLVLDGAELAARAIGADTITVAVHRGNGIAQHLMSAVADRAAMGWGSVRVTVAEAPGRYVSSESTALASVLGGGEAKPRSVSARESGVDGRPTLVSNVETYAHLALIARYGANWYRMAGAGSQPGTALFTVSGAVNNVGVYELPTGITGDTILRVAGGVREPLSGVLVGGYGGTWITPTELSRPVTDIGAGVFLAMPSRVCGLLEVGRVASWMASQTANQCGPCFKGLPAVAEDVTRIVMDGDRQAYDRLRFRLGVINGRGACAHPDGVIRFVATAFRVFNQDVRRHLAGNHCPPGPRVLPLPTGESEGWR
ncbi:NADH-ubiquinone oxidoreductase-F iron-sulfur binding region domain-containing protein [Kibdelosporangium lantanae]